MTNNDYLKGFIACKNEIEDLRRKNKELSIEVNAMNKVLHAVNSHRETDRCYGERQDIIWKLKDTIEDLETKIKEK